MIFICQCIAYERGHQRVSGVFKFILFGVFTTLGWLIYKFSNVYFIKKSTFLEFLTFPRKQNKIPNLQFCRFAVLGQKGLTKAFFHINLLNCMFFRSTGAPVFLTFKQPRCTDTVPVKAAM